MCAFDLPDADTRNEFLKLAFDDGVLVLGCGVRSIRFRPVLSVANVDIDEGLEIVARVLKKLERTS